MDKALRSAQSGDYSIAIRLFREVLRLAPAHVDARRNLGMALFESGQTDEALNEFIDVLRQAPKDVWTLVLVANLFFQVKQDLQTAERYYKSALQLNPGDVYALSNYGALLAQAGRTEEARRILQETIAENPEYPNPYYSLALLELQAGNVIKSTEILEKLFVETDSTDKRSQVVYEHARELYRSAMETLAKESDQIRSLVEARKTEIERSLTTRIEIVEDRQLRGADAVCEMAWNHGREYHRIVHRAGAHRRIIPHLLAHEMEHIVLEDDAYRAGNSRSFVTTARTNELAMQSMAAFVNRAKKKRQFGPEYQRFLDDIIRGLCNQLFNCPIDMIVEQRLYDYVPALRPAQFVSLKRTMLSNAMVLKDKEIAKITPPTVFRANVTMNCAYALFVDQMYRGKTEYAKAYIAEDVFRAANHLCSLFTRAWTGFEPGAEYRLVDEFANVLKLKGWYEWAAPRVQRPHATAPKQDLEPRREGVTNPELLSEKEPAAIMFCIDALTLFSGMSPQQVREITLEIALLGRSGLDYSSGERKYTLRNLPGRTFSGLHLMCLMYVGFKRVDPSVDVGMPLESAYRQALQLYGKDLDVGEE